jgi:glycosyltransferase involved in cell wall biosynthesis
MEKNNPLISIVTPSFNQGCFIEETIKSIISQNYNNFEYIIVDGASKDNTIDVLERYNGHNKIKNIIIEKDNGQTDALIKGFNLCSGKIFGWVNSDDMLTKNALEIVANNFINRAHIDILVGNVMWINKTGQEIGVWPRKILSNDDWYHMPQVNGQPSTFFTKRVFDEVGGLDRTLDYSMDYDLFMRFATHGCNFCYIDDILSYFRVHDNSKTTQTISLPYKQWKEDFRVFLKNGGSLFSGFTYWKIRGILSTIVKTKILKNRRWKT